MPGRTPRDDERPRLIELLAAFSLVTDLARGHPEEEALRASLLAAELARRCGLSPDEVTTARTTALLRFVGCTATSHEYAVTFGGDDVRVRALGDLIDPTNRDEAIGFLVALFASLPEAERGAAIALAASRAPGVIGEGVRADCEVAVQTARRLALGTSIEESLAHAFERWDGHGGPLGLAGEAIPLPSRVAAVAFAAVMFWRLRSKGAAAEGVERWSGRILDPSLAARYVRDQEALLEAADVPDAWAAVTTSRSTSDTGVLGGHLDAAQLDDVCRAFGELADLKSVWFHGHAAGVAALAEKAATLTGLPADTCTTVRLAGLLHDLGRAAVSTGTWERPGPLSTAEWEQVRLHPYHSHRVLARVPALAAVARVGGDHHERIDGSGYYRAAEGRALGRESRLLAAADAFHAMTEARPHRPPRSRSEAVATLEAQAGRFGTEAVDAVLHAAGQFRAGRQVRRKRPAGLTAREIDVLRLLARGSTEKEIAAALVVSPSTVHTHVTHVYEKAAVSTRAAAAMFAMRHDLLEEDEVA